MLVHACSPFRLSCIEAAVIQVWSQSCKVHVYIMHLYGSRVYRCRGFIYFNQCLSCLFFCEDRRSSGDSISTLASISKCSKGLQG